MRALIVAAAAAAMALALPSLAASAVVTARPAASAAVSVHGWGTNNDGELGSGSGTTDFPAPVKVKVPAGVTVTSIRAGCYHSVALTKAGALLAWGSNASGQLGDGSFKRRNTPVSVRLPKGTKISAVRAGCQDTIALTRTGTVLAWGMGLGGALGNGQTRNSAVPVQVSLPQGTKVKAISAGCAHNLALTTAGAVYAWGSNEFGQLGDGTHRNRHKPVRVKLPAGVTATSVTAGCSDSFALTNDGLFAWGVNAHGQLGTGDLKSHDSPVLIAFLFRGAGPGSITSVFAGCDDTYALFSKGGVLAWGSDDHGQLGDGGNSTQVKPVGVMLPTTIKVKAISAGCSNGYALSTAGQVFAWGLGGQGGLGDASDSDAPVPVAVHDLTTVTVTAIGAGPAANHAFAIGVKH
jgi:alpha-tubulin suppressor-like RCC1 family protein